MAIELTDDGTMDTVLRCDECGEEFRFTYQPGPEEEDTDQTDEEAYDAYIESCIEEIEAEHECATDDEP